MEIAHADLQSGATALTYSARHKLIVANGPFIEIAGQQKRVLRQSVLHGLASTAELIVCFGAKELAVLSSDDG